MKITAIDIPKDSVIVRALDAIDYADAYTTAYDFKRRLPLESVVKSFFLAFPWWVLCLLKLRNGLVAMLGLKRPDGREVAHEIKRFQGRIGESIALFKVYQRTNNEILTGLNDKHLDFRVSFMVHPAQENSTQITIATIVQFKHWIGRIYFLPVRPLHQIIIPSILKRMVKLLGSSPYSSLKGVES